MADVIVTNEVPATANAWFALFRLYETMLSAGWTHVRSSRGTADTPSGTDRWAGAFASLVADAWVVLQANSGQQVIFRRGSSSSTVDGWVVWLKDGGHVNTNETALRPGDLPADAVFIRGTGTVPGTYTTDGPWFGGSTLGVATLNIGCRDASGTGDESFWLIAQTPGNAYTTTTTHGVHRLALERVEHMAGLGIVDANPYAWWCPESNTANWTDGMDNLQTMLHEDNSGDSIGLWRRWWNAGQAGEAFKKYAAGQVYQGDVSNPQTTGDNPPFDPAFAANSDEAIYQATPVQIIRRVRLMKSAEVAFQDPEGGFTQNIFFSSDAVNNLNTLDGGNYAKFGDWCVVWWDGNSGNPPVEN